MRLDAIMQVRRNSPILTYSKQEARLATHAGINRRHSQEDWRFFWKVTAVGCLVLAGCLYVTIEPIQAGDTVLHASSAVDSVGSALLRGKRSDRKRLLYAAPPPSTYARSMWTMDEFWVLEGSSIGHGRSQRNGRGINLAQFGFELTTDHPSSSWIEKPFALYEDFDVSSSVSTEESERGISSNGNGNNNLKVYDLLEEHRHLDHSSLAFYIDKIAQKRYLEANFVPIPTPIVYKYKDEIDDLNQVAHIQTLFPNQTDFVAKPSHRHGYAKLVKYDRKDSEYSMGSSPDYGNKMDQDYDPDSIAHTLAHTLNHAKVHRVDPWSLHFITPGVIVEDRMVSVFDPHQPPIQLNVYMIWGRVWMALWSNYENEDNVVHPSMVYRNGTVVVLPKDDSQQHLFREVPDWLPWGRVVQVAEDLAAHKDIYQVNLLVGVSAATARKHQHENLSPEERLEDLQVVVVDTRLDPAVSDFPDRDGLLQEFGRLWFAGYHMGIYRTVPNTEVPSLFLMHHRLTQADAKWLNIKENLVGVMQRAIFKGIAHVRKISRRT